MAIYHCHIQVGKRSAGRSACGAAAYRSADKIRDEESKLEHDFTRKSGVIHSEIMLPKNAPLEYQDREKLWNSVQAAERAKNGQLFREIEVGLPVEISREQQMQIGRDYCQQFVDAGMCVDWSMHDKGDGNPHIHILMPLRGIDENGKWLAKRRDVYANDRDKDGNPIFNPDKPGGKENRIPRLDADGRQKLDKKGARVWERVKVETNDWNNPANAEKWRESWARVCNKYLDENHQIDHRSYERQGVDKVATIHEGQGAREREKQGKTSERCELNREIRELNAARQRLEIEQRGIIIDLAKARHERALKQMHDEIQAIRNYGRDDAERAKRLRQKDAITRRKHAEKFAAEKSEIASQQTRISAIDNKISGLKAKKEAAAYSKNLSATVEAVKMGVAVGDDAIKKILPKDLGEVYGAAKSILIDSVMNPSNLLPHNMVKNAFSAIAKCAAAGQKDAQSFLHNTGGSWDKVAGKWEDMSEMEKDELMHKALFVDDYGVESATDKFFKFNPKKSVSIPSPDDEKKKGFARVR